MNLFFITIAFALFVIGYRVFESDQLQYLLLPFRTLYTNFCPQDWFVWQTSHYHYSFSYLVQFLYYISAGHLEIAFFLGWAIVIFGVIHSLYRLTIVTGGEYVHFVGVLLMLAVYSSHGLGDSIVYTNTFIPTGIAFAVSIYAFSYLFEGKFIASFSLLGVAAFIHVNYGIIGFPVFILYLFVTNKPVHIKRVSVGIVVFLALSLPMLMPTVFKFKDGGDWLWLSYLLRSPHHYDPRVFGWVEWTETLLPMVLALWLSVRLCESIPPGKEFKQLLLLIGIISIVCLAVLGFNIFFPQRLLFYKIYVWRLAPFLLIFSYIIISRVCMNPQIWNRYGVSVIVLIITAFLVINYGAMRGILRAFLLFIGIYTLQKLYIKRATVPGVTTALIVFILATSGFKGIHIYNHNPEMEWIRKNTPESALFMIPPDLGTVRLLARRSVIVDLKCAPIGVGKEMYEWKKRLETVTASPPLESLGIVGYDLWNVLTDNYLKVTPEQVRAVMNQYGAVYFITYPNHKNITLFESSSFETVYSSKTLIIFFKKE